MAMDSLIYIRVELVPIDVASTVAFVHFQRVGKHLRCCSEAEVEAGVRAKNDATSHFETVQVASNVHSSGCKLLVLEVITRGEIDFPAIGNANVTREVHILSKLIGVSHTLDIDLRRTVFGHYHTI